MPTFDRETKRLVNASRTLGSGGHAVYLEDWELSRLCALVANDLGQTSLVAAVADPSELTKGYYGTSLDWFQRPVGEGIEFPELFLSLRERIADFQTYFRCLCGLHKRRLKFSKVLQMQAVPKIETIAPRCLLEYGMRPFDTLASWMVWRKWLYDIDGRSGQETGYLFELILANAIGGVSYSPRKSPIKRHTDPSKGRQVDCLEGKTAYEFKTRVTIAASGQGRFREELDFAKDCHTSGYKPVLLVLDQTPSSRLDALSAEYAKYAGMAYIGPEAWSHLKEKAGEAMWKFVDQYVRVPLEQVDKSAETLLPLTIVDNVNTISVQLGGQQFTIPRVSPEEQVENVDDGTDDE